MDLEARKIEFRLVRGSSFQELMRGTRDNDGSRHPPKKAAGPRKDPKAVAPVVSDPGEAHVKSAGPSRSKRKASIKAAMAKSGRHRDA